MQFSNFKDVVIGKSGNKNSIPSRPKTNAIASRNPLATTGMNKNAPSKLNVN